MVPACLATALPTSLRVWAARRAVARLKHAEPSAATRRASADAPTVALLAGALLCSALLGFLAGEGTRPPDAAGAAVGAAAGAAAGAAVEGGATAPGPPALGAALPSPAARAVGRIDPEAGPEAGPEATGPDPLWAELGRVRAEILRLRVLFRRLAEVAELDDGEFDLDLEPLELPEVRRAADALDLSIRALDPISGQSARMARIFDERRAAHDRRVGGRVAPGTVRASGFGHRADPFGGRRQLHLGIDLAGPPGTPVHALADGIVAYSGANGGYGNLVELEHDDGFRTRYAHNRRNLVATGDLVRKGEAVATLGSSGRATGPHVHVEVRHHGVPLDPAHFIR